MNEKQNPMARGCGIGEYPFCGSALVGNGVYADAGLSAPTPCGACGSCRGQYDEKAKVCGFGVESGVLAALYVPMQGFEGIYDTASAWRRGTMFEGLDKPFYGDGKEVDCRGREK